MMNALKTAIHLPVHELKNVKIGVNNATERSKTDTLRGLWQEHSATNTSLQKYGEWHSVFYLLLVIEK